ncbi:NAD(+)/NADH kinase [soil metagenome]
MRVNLVANIHRLDALEAASHAETLLQTRGFDVGWEVETARQIARPAIPSEKLGDCELVIAFGGDGTLIRAAHLCSAKGTPILGVYYGSFGFVTQCTSRALEPCLDDFFRGALPLDRRIMLEADLLRGGNVVASLHALNEIALQRSITARMLNFEIHINDHRVTSYPADGVIVCTPTGTTAYNLSAGGPILDPNVQAIVLTALAPHTLSARPLVVNADSEIRLIVERAGDAIVSSDAQTRLHLLSGDEVRVTRSERVTNLVVVERDDFLIKLGQKLFWHQGLIGEDS